MARFPLTITTLTVLSHTLQLFYLLDRLAEYLSH